MDITAHLLDAEKDNVPPHIYTNVGSEKNYATFTYVFQFDKEEVCYTYCKANSTELLLEAIAINGKEVLLHNFVDEKDNYIKCNCTTKELREAHNLEKNVPRREFY